MLFPTSLAVAAYPMFIPLLNGGTLATLDVHGVGLAPVAEFLVRERITLAYMAPTVVRFLVDAGCSGSRFPDLRMIALGGEVVDAESVRLTIGLFGRTCVANGFGARPRRGSSACTSFTPMLRSRDGSLRAIRWRRGAPLVLDEHGHGTVPGPEIGGDRGSPRVPGLLGHQDLSDQVLSADPSGRTGWSLYRTGDLGRLDEHGSLVITAGSTPRSRCGGGSSCWADVEADLHELDGVADGAVVPVSRDGNVELRAVVVLAARRGADRRCGPSSLLATRPIASRRWVVLDELPRLPQRQDGSAGPSRSPTWSSGHRRRPAPPPVPTAPRTTTRSRERLRRIWEGLLPAGTIGLDENFMDLGGDSLLAAQMLVVVEREMGVTVPMGELVHARTVRELAAVVGRLSGERRARRSPRRPACRPGEPSPTEAVVRPRPPGFGLPGPPCRRRTWARTSRSGASSPRCWPVAEPVPNPR